MKKMIFTAAMMLASAAAMAQSGTFQNPSFFCSPL